MRRKRLGLGLEEEAGPTCMPRSSGSTSSSLRKSTSSEGYLFCWRGKRTEEAPLQHKGENREEWGVKRDEEKRKSGEGVVFARE